MKFLQNTIIFAIFVLSVVSARMLFDSDRQDMEPAGADSIFTPYAAQPYDQQAAATGGHEHGRVQIKVYRGPDTHGDHHEHFAPHGFWVKQPADDDHHH